MSQDKGRCDRNKKRDMELHAQTIKNLIISGFYVFTCKSVNQL